MSEYIAKCSEVVSISGKPLIIPDCIDTSEEIVRCRDCRRFHPRESSLLSCHFELDNGLVQWRYAEPDGFCKWSEKKEVDG